MEACVCNIIVLKFNYQIQISENQDTTDIEEQAERLNTQWGTVKKALVERKLQIDYLLAKKQLHNEIDSMTNIFSVS